MHWIGYAVAVGMLSACATPREPALVQSAAQPLGDLTAEQAVQVAFDAADAGDWNAAFALADLDAVDDLVRQARIRAEVQRRFGDAGIPPDGAVMMLYDGPVPSQVRIEPDAFEPAAVRVVGSDVIGDVTYVRIESDGAPTWSVPVRRVRGRWQVAMLDLRDPDAPASPDDL